MNVQTREFPVIYYQEMRWDGILQETAAEGRGALSSNENNEIRDTRENEMSRVGH